MTNKNYPIRSVEDDVAIWTMDVDWAPDPVLEFTVKFFLCKNIPLTIFGTHESEFLKSVQNDPLIEIGLHPDFSKDINSDEHLSTLKKIYPSAIGARTHRNLDGRNVVNFLASHDLIYHSNKILFGQQNLQPLAVYNGMTEFPYFWEDGHHLELNIPMSIDQVALTAPGMKIFSIHPVVFYLNSDKKNHWRLITEKFTDLTKAPLREFDKFTCSSFGLRNLTEEIIAYQEKRAFKFKRLKDLI